MAMLAVFPLIERSGVGLCILNLLMVTSIVVALHRVRVRRSGCSSLRRSARSP